MKPEDNAYLNSLAFAEGEYRNSQAQFDTAAAALGKILEAQVGDVMRANLQKDIAQEWVTAADTLLKSILAERAVSDRQAVLAVGELQDSLADNCQLDRDTVEAEVQAFSNDCAQRVLASWYAELHSLSIPKEGIPLNANMLPGTRSIEELLEAMDFGVFGVTSAVVGHAVRAYREWLVKQASNGIISFAPQLFILFDMSNANQPFQCFVSMGDAEGARLTRAQKASPKDHAPIAARAKAQPTPSDRLERLVSMLKAIRYATLPTETAPHVEIGKLANAVALLLHELPKRDLTHSPDWSPFVAPHHAIGQHGEAERMLLDSVGMGVDIFSSALSANLYSAENMLSAKSGPIRALLFRYASARGVMVDAVVDLYAVNVTAGVECQLGQNFDDLMNATSSHEVIVRELERVHGMSSQTATQLLEDSRSGTAYIACPLG
jgi:hypothetical protein